MSYKVICAFTDLQDHNHVYLVGDKFPHDNKIVSEIRIRDLLSKNNKIGKPVIKAEENDFTKKMNYLEESMTFTELRGEEKYTKTEINRMSTAELKELAAENGIENSEEMTGSELKKILIEKFGL